MAVKYTKEQLNKLDKGLYHRIVPGTSGAVRRTEWSDTGIK